MKLAHQWVAAAALIGGLTTAPAAASDAVLPPPYEGAYQPVGIDEIGLWRQDDEYERILAASPTLIRDETLSDYLRGVLCATVGQDRCQSVRMYVVREPMFNASMTPNGTMRVYSGLLLRVRDEAELGAILGHEFAHFERRHTVSHFKKARAGSDLAAWVSVLAAMAPNSGYNRGGNDVQIAIYGDIFRFARNQEREADLLGVSYLNANRIRPQAAANVWRNVMAEAEASAAVRGLKKPNFHAIAFAASHPPNAERASYLTELADPAGEEWDDGAQRYRDALRPWLPQFLDDQIKLNDFGASEFVIKNLAADGWTAPLYFARGELYRLRGGARDMVQAADFYNQAIAIEQDHPHAHRGLGLALLKLNRATEGKAALKRYLELASDASDVKMIQLMLTMGE